jgi:hypothetical protein
MAPRPSAIADTQIYSGKVDFSKEPYQPEEKRRHGGNEQDRHRNRRIEVQRSAEKQYGNDGANEQRRGRAKSDRAVDQLRSAREHGEIDAQRGEQFRSGSIQSFLQHAGAIDDPAEPIGHDGKNCADAGEQKHRCHGEFNHVGYGDVGMLRHREFCRGTPPGFPLKSCGMTDSTSAYAVRTGPYDKNIRGDDLRQGH